MPQKGSYEKNYATCILAQLYFVKIRTQKEHSMTSTREKWNRNKSLYISSQNRYNGPNSADKGSLLYQINKSRP